MGRENVSISLFWADPVELWMKLNHGEKLNALVFLLSFLPSPLFLQYYDFLLYCTDEGPSTWTVKEVTFTFGVMSEIQPKLSIFPDDKIQLL